MKRMSIYITGLLILCNSEFFTQQKLTLDQCKELAIRNNIETRNSRLEVKAAGEIRKSAFTGYFPNISASGTILKANKSIMEMEMDGGDLPVYDGNSANIETATQFAYFPSSSMGLIEKMTVGFINVIQPVFMGGRIINGNKLANLGEEVSMLQSELMENDVLISTEEKYWGIVSLEEKKLTLNMYEELLFSIKKQVSDAYNSGVALKNDLLKVKLRLNEIKLSKSKLNNGSIIAKMAFCQSLGIPYDSLLVLNDNLFVNEAPVYYKVDHTEALKNRKEYTLLKKSVRAEELKTNMKLGELLPQAAVGLSGLYMKIDETDSRSVGMVFGTVSIPISSWWGGSHELRERSIKEEIAENNFKDNSELLLLQMEKAWQDFSNSYKEYLLSVEAENQAMENLKVNKDSYNNGIITIADLLEAQALHQAAKDQLTATKANYKIKKAHYLQVTGR